MAGTRRERELARSRYLRQQARRAQARARARRRRRLVASVAAVLVALAGVVGLARALRRDAPASTTTAAQQQAGDGTAAGAKVCAAPPAKPAEARTYPREPKLTIDRRAAYTMAVKTTCGDITVAMDAKHAPRTVNSFAFLAGKGYFRDAPCHRLSTTPSSTSPTATGLSVLQCGDPTGSGTGGPGYRLPDENLPSAGKGGHRVYAAGTVAMANAGKGTGGSQFFLVYRDSTLPPRYSVFGRMVTGRDVVEKVARAGVAPSSANPTDGPPAQPISILDVEVTEKKKA